MTTDNPLPYKDTKPQGAADFYFAINATFRFIRERAGIEGLRRYWGDLGHSYYRPVTDSWRSGGLGAVAVYWRAFFQAEPGGEVEVREEEGRVVLEIRCCPAIAHLRSGGRVILPEFCEHCHFVSDAMASGAGLAARIEGGNGTCRQEFFSITDAPPQGPISFCS